jgi:hypothetical protein
VVLAASSRNAPLDVWAHVALTQQVDERGVVVRRSLFVDGVEWASPDVQIPIHNPSPEKVSAVSASAGEAFISVCRRVWSLCEVQWTMDAATRCLDKSKILHYSSAHWVRCVSVLDMVGDRIVTRTNPF